MSAELLELPTPPHKVVRETMRRIEVRAGELPRMLTEAQDALIAANAGIYQRGGQLVRVATLDADVRTAGINRLAGSVVIVPVLRDYLLLALSRSAEWVAYDKRSKSLKAVSPPSSVACAMLAAVGEWHFPHLAGITSAPTLRADGTLLDAPGYDSESGLFASFHEGAFPTIASEPSRADALDALALLRDLFEEFPFSGGAESAHAAVLLSAVITACVRAALKTAPAYGISAHKAGSGKTTAARAIAQVSSGRDAPVISPTDDEAEFRKALLSILMAGDSVVLIDNVAKPVDSAALCAALTSATYSDRVLGASQKVNVGTAATWLLTGNHLEFVGDLTSRTLLAVLDPELERPESRTFRCDLSEYITEKRGDLVRAALTIPLAYMAAGSPKVEAERSRFAEWDAFVRRPLLWLDVADPLDTQAELRATDPVREALIGLHAAWRVVFGDAPTTVATAIEVATGEGMSAKPQLRDALLEVAGERGEINARRLGRYLVRHARRIENGLRIEDAGADRLSKRKLFKVSGVSGVSGVISRPTRVIVSSANTSGWTETNTGNASNAGEVMP